MNWVVERLQGSAATLHEFTPPPRARRTLRSLAVDSPAVVIGSSQPESDIDHRSAAQTGVEVVRRRSGGGAVLLVPAQYEWIDFWLPAGDVEWRDDVVTAAEWLGELFMSALCAGGVDDLSVHRGPASTDALARKVCFLGRGPGEVFCGPRKVVGLSQRRTRDWIRFQTIVHRRFSAEQTAGLIAVRSSADVPRKALAQRLQSQVFEIGALALLDLLRLRLR